MNNFFKFLFLYNFFFFSFLTTIKSKDYDLKSYMCADEIGPILEFSIPKLDKSKNSKISFKIYESDNRNFFDTLEGIIFKKSSPIDTSYSYYAIHSILKVDGSNFINFEFYPPSHLLLKKGGSQFVDLVCWNENK